MSKSKPVFNATRRKVLKGTTVAASAAAVGPWVVSPKALSSSGEVNCTIWTDYIPANVIEDFTAATGIKVNYKELGSNEELINQMKATKGAGVDLCSPTNNRSGQWVDLDLLQETLLRLSQLVGDFEDDLAELDVNPFIVTERADQSFAVDARVRLTGPDDL